MNRILRVVGAALAGTVNATDEAVPPADPREVRALLAEVGLLRPGAFEAQVSQALRRFQARAGLPVDGVAGPRTVHALTRYAREARHLRALGVAA
ncbi:peptidoglycan-binding domain-containing protein [Dactylosporangium sp. AC04546]|uniref:peptidoglycan-binding protein n=1 Tax=Dactylosporangium sp. AC04546 TaxID=2862460 RepID=UPI001EDE1C6F|nr:peptidoglycan-binding domain-containing protein [Dactylosporangium sp. AC04546]WVK79936.1 peptidoglycan-binding domain-containing protein [Dactylosporangium sp. AC04546]